MNIDQHILQALGKEPDAGPPADFARSVAASAGPVNRPAAAAFEQWLLRGLAILFALSALAVVALYGRAWLVPLSALPAAAGLGTTINWMLAAGACVALNWLLARLRPARP
jgi:hypothetical protein